MKLFGAVDLGSANFVVLAAQPSGSSWELLGWGKRRARGYEGGRLTDIDAAAEVLAGAVHDAEAMAGGTFVDVYAGVSGIYLLGEDKRVPVAIGGDTVTQADMDLAQDTLRAFPIPAGKKILHVLQQSYAIDQQPSIRQPLGMTGQLLEAEAHVVSADANALADLNRCLTKAGIRKAKLCASILGAAETATTVDERQMGVATLDWGAGVCDIAVFKDGMLRSVSALDLGGKVIDMDIAVTFRIPNAEAERLKREIGSAVQVPHDADEVRQVTTAAGDDTAEINAHVLAMTIEARVEEMFRQIGTHLETAGGASKLAAGVVISGGCANLEGLHKIAPEVLKMPLRIGRAHYAGPLYEDIANPEFATSAGLIEMHLGLVKEQPEHASKSLWRRLAKAFSPHSEGT